MPSAIQWTDETWNPVRGCTKVSPGCKHCYAETFAERFRGVKGHPYEQGFDLRLVPDALDKPLHWKKPRKVFVNSMSDLFHEGVPDEFIAAVFGVMAACPQHTFQILTKRADRLPEWFEWVAAQTPSQHPFGAARGVRWFAWAGGCGRHIEEVRVSYSADDPPNWPWPLPNVWIGVSVEDQERADERIPALKSTPAAVRFLSCEPLLGPVFIERHLATHHNPEHRRDFNYGEPISWVIVGGESGAGARPFDIAWARSIVEQCKTARVPCFVKQLGAQFGHDFGSEQVNGSPLGWQRWPLRDRKGGDPAEWPEDLRVREFPR